MISRAFEYATLPMRVVFGAGSLRQLPGEVDLLGLSRLLVICSPEQRDVGERVLELLGSRGAEVLAVARMHVPVAVADQATTRAKELGVDGCLVVGGGSAVGLGKAVALQLGLPVVAVPTSYAGSEMTSVWGLSEDGVKRTGRDRAVLPVSVVYDATLTTTMPVGFSVSSGMNAIAHAVEGLYAPDTSPILELMAQEGVRALVAALPGIVEEPTDLEARSEAQYGAWLCGAVLGATTMGLHHQLCHTLGGSLGLPHAATHSVVLPHVVAYNKTGAPAAIAKLATAVGQEDPAGALFDLAARLGAPSSLRGLGMDESGVAHVARLVVERPYANPCPVTDASVVALLDAALVGKRPS